MHEYDITRKITEMILEESKTRRITPKRVIIDIGKLTTYKPEPIMYYFNLLKKDYEQISDVELEIHNIDIKIRCNCCNKTKIVEDLPFCPDCETADVEVLEGEDVMLRKIEYV